MPISASGSVLTQGDGKIQLSPMQFVTFGKNNSGQSGQKQTQHSVVR